VLTLIVYYLSPTLRQRHHRSHLVILRLCEPFYNKRKQTANMIMLSLVALLLAIAALIMASYSLDCATSYGANSTVVVNGDDVVSRKSADWVRVQDYLSMPARGVTMRSNVVNTTSNGYFVAATTSDTTFGAQMAGLRSVDGRAWTALTVEGVVTAELSYLSAFDETKKRILFLPSTTTEDDDIVALTQTYTTAYSPDDGPGSDDKTELVSSTINGLATGTRILALAAIPVGGFCCVCSGAGEKLIYGVSSDGVSWDTTTLDDDVVNVATFENTQATLYCRPDATVIAANMFIAGTIACRIYRLSSDAGSAWTTVSLGTGAVPSCITEHAAPTRHAMQSDAATDDATVPAMPSASPRIVLLMAHTVNGETDVPEDLATMRTTWFSDDAGVTWSSPLTPPEDGAETAAPSSEIIRTGSRSYEHGFLHPQTLRLVALGSDGTVYVARDVSATTLAPATGFQYRNVASDMSAIFPAGTRAQLVSLSQGRWILACSDHGAVAVTDRPITRDDLVADSAPSTRSTKRKKGKK